MVKIRFKVVPLDSSHRPKFAHTKLGNVNSNNSNNSNNNNNNSKKKHDPRMGFVYSELVAALVSLDG